MGKGCTIATVPNGFIRQRVKKIVFVRGGNDEPSHDYEVET